MPANYNEEEIKRSLQTGQKNLRMLCSGELHRNPNYQGKYVAFQDSTPIAFDSREDWYKKLKKMSPKEVRHFSTPHYIPRPEEVRPIHMGI